MLNRLLSHDLPRSRWLAAALVVIVLGLALALLKGPIVIALGLAGIAIAWLYSAPAVQLSGKGVGEFFLMIAFGAAFGYTVMARMSLLIGRLTDLIEYSDPSYGRPTLWLALVTIGTLIALSLRSRSEPPEEG